MNRIEHYTAPETVPMDEVLKIIQTQLEVMRAQLAILESMATPHIYIPTGHDVTGEEIY